MSPNPNTLTLFLNPNANPTPNPPLPNPNQEHGVARQWVLESIRPSTLPPDPKQEYGPSGRVSEEAYLRMCADTRGVLLHALKW